MENTHKENIIKLHNQACPSFKIEIEKLFPDAFKSELEVGKWYKDTKYLECLINYQGGGSSNNYGFSLSGKWCKELGNAGNERLVLATEQEVKEALIKEAEKRGFAFRVCFKEIEDVANGGEIDKCGKVGSSFDYKNGNLYAIGYGRWCVFKDGKWAEIIKETKVTLSDLVDFYKKEKGIDNVKVV